MHKLFVYGTLKEGYGNHHYIKGSKQLSKTASVEGYGMHRLGGFPGAVADQNSEIYGEVYEIDDATLKDCDGLEGYRPDKPDYGLYNRIVVDALVVDDVESHRCFMYTYNGSIAGRPKVEGGKW